jgi:hypothetical protein
MKIFSRNKLKEFVKSIKKEKIYKLSKKKLKENRNSNKLLKNTKLK